VVVIGLDVPIEPEDECAALARKNVVTVPRSATSGVQVVEAANQNRKVALS